MASPSRTPSQTRRQLLSRIGMVAGSAALYQAMTSMGHAMGTDFSGPPKLSGTKKEHQFWFWGLALQVC